MEILIIIVMMFILCKCVFSVIERINWKSTERKFVRYYDGNHGKGSYKRAVRTARLEQRN